MSAPISAFAAITPVRAHRLPAPAASPAMDGNTVETLIALVEERPAIWNKNNQNHSCRLEVEKCWKEIGAALQVDENTLRKKWKYLRDQFCVELGKVQKSGAGTSKWRHYKALNYLKSTVSARIYGKEEEYESELDEDEQSSSDYFERLSTLAEAKKKKKEKPKKKKKNKAKSIPDNDSVSDKLGFEDEDEHLHFFKSILSHVRKIPESKLLSFRGRMQCLVEEFAYGPNPTTEFVPEFPIKGSPVRYSSEACDPIDTSE